MKTISISAFLTMLFFLLSCKETEKEKITRLVTEWQGKEIRFPKEMVFTRYLTDTVDWQIPESDYKVLIYVDSIGCTSCKLQLHKWKEMIDYTDSITGSKVPFVFVFQPKDLKEMQYLLKRDRFDLPVYMDLDDRLNKLNRFPSDLTFQTFLLNKENRVVVLGNPVHNLAVKDLYLKQIAGHAPSPNKRSIQTTAETEQAEINLGSFDTSEKKTALFQIKNTGDHPLVLLDVATTCGCAMATFDKKPAQPGESLQVKVDYSPKESGFFDETITVKCNTEKWIKLKIKGQVR